MRIPWVAACLLLTVSLLAAEGPETMEEGRFIRIGHRGASGYLPENTLAAFRRAVELGADMVELDVHMSLDGRIMVIHDETVDRTTDGKGLVAEMTAAELQRLDAGGGEKIPTLEDVLELIDGRRGINVELKGPGTAGPVAKLLEQFIAERGLSWNLFIASSFDHAQLEQLHQIEPRLRRAPLFNDELPSDWFEVARRLGAWSVNLNKASITAPLVERVHSEGMRVLVYTVNEPKEIARFRGLGVDGIFCDYPDRLR